MSAMWNKNITNTFRVWHHGEPGRWFNSDGICLGYILQQSTLQVYRDADGHLVWRYWCGLTMRERILHMDVAIQEIAAAQLRKDQWITPTQ